MLARGPMLIAHCSLPSAPCSVPITQCYLFSELYVRVEPPRRVVPVIILPSCGDVGRAWRVARSWCPASVFATAVQAPASEGTGRNKVKYPSIKIGSKGGGACCVCARRQRQRYNQSAVRHNDAASNCSQCPAANFIVVTNLAVTTPAVGVIHAPVVIDDILRGTRVHGPPALEQPATIAGGITWYIVQEKTPKF